MPAAQCGAGIQRCDDGAYAALAEVCAAFAAFSRASLARICDSVSCTWLSNTYCAGRWFSIGISGAIGPVVLTPRQAKFFPLWALARYRNLNSGNAPAVAYGM